MLAIIVESILLLTSYSIPNNIKTKKFTKKKYIPIGKVNNRKRTEYISAIIKTTEDLPSKSFSKRSFRVLCNTPLNTNSVEIADKDRITISKITQIKSAFWITRYCSSK